jgi:hypothetical protein
MSFEYANWNGRAFLSHPGAANSRGGRGGFCAETWAIRGLPFTTRGDEVETYELVPQFPSPVLRVTGSPLSPCIELTDGTKIECRESTLDGVWSGGIEQVWTIPVANLTVETDGEWAGWCCLKTLEVVGNCDVTIQPEPPEGHETPVDMIYGGVIYARTRNNIYYPDGTSTLAMTGKEGNIRRPEVFPLLANGQPAGPSVMGRLRKREEGGRVYVDKMVLQADIAMAVKVRTSATLGYTTLGVSVDGAALDGFRMFDSYFYTPAAEFTVDSMSWGLGGSGTYRHEVGIYSGTGNTGDPLVSNSVFDTGDYSHSGPDFAVATYSTKPVLSGAGNFTFTIRRNIAGSLGQIILYDANTGPTGRIYISQSTTPATLPTPAATRTNREFSAFVTGTESGGAIIPQIMHHRQQQRST